MSWTAQYSAMARYNRWMNRKLYTLAATLTDEERKRDLGAFFGSIHRTLNHILLGDRIWLGRLAGIMSAVTEYDDFAELRRERELTDEILLTYAAGLTDAQLLAEVAYKTLAGVPHQMPLWQPVGHMFNHQTHHRGQATTLFKQLGHDPGVTDLVAMYREEAA